jgi:hypothetical protein
MVTERKMGPKGFLQKANRAAVAGSAAGFIAAYREYLVNSEVSYATAPLVEKLDKGEAYPTPTLGEIQRAVMAHIMMLDLLKAQESAEKSSKPSQTRKPFIAYIRDGSGKVCLDDEGKEVKATFDLPQRAFDWVDRRLFNSSPDCFGEVTHLRAHNPSKATDYVNRDDSIARILKRPRTPVMKVNKPAQSGLGFGVKVKETSVKFSQG